ncbi:uncharacterized protein [Battus philenor]|uniref:uncharacterized protein n=1 Tax=Battus philenor TaxID=42288 RepID=UPI0035CFDBB3
MKRLASSQFIFMSCLVALSTADEGYDDNLTKPWSLSSASKIDGSVIVNSPSAFISTNYGDRKIGSVRKTKDLKGSPSDLMYGFKPRAIPLRENQQVERNIYHSHNLNDKYKSEIPFPGNYLQIAKLKGTENVVNESPYNAFTDATFHPGAIPLIWNPEFHGRSLNEDEELSLEKPEEVSEQTASRRSLSYVLGAEDEEDEPDEEEEEEGEYDVGEVDGNKNSHPHYSHIKNKLKKKSKKVTKYMMPLLLAYKLKYFALVPVMIAGLILLIGATGLAGFFFALFAAVMGLQKGGGY